MQDNVFDSAGGAQNHSQSCTFVANQYVQKANATDARVPADATHAAPSRHTLLIAGGLGLLLLLLVIAVVVNLNKKGSRT